MNIVEKAVSHLKEEAVERATKNAVELIDTVLAELEAADWDLNVAAPRAKNVYDRKTYVSMNAKHTLYGSIATYTKTSLSRNEPNIRKQCNESEARFINIVREDAAAQYEAFVAKLTEKVGEVSSATLEGNHVWGYSFLTVETAEGESQIWKTQMIINVSKLGKLFNQFPTRKVKNAV